MRKSRPKKRPKTVYCVVIEGETEKWYLQLIKKHEDLPKIDIKPELPKRKGLDEIKELVTDLLKESYDRIFWLIDLDIFINRIDKLKEAINSIKKKDASEKLAILINNPCLEFWYLLHFRDTGKYYPTCEKVVKEIKKHEPLSTYQKSEKYYKGNPDIYQKLKPYQKKAIEVAKNLDRSHKEPLDGASAQIYKLLEALGIT